MPYNHYTMLRSVEDLFGFSTSATRSCPGEVVRLGHVRLRAGRATDGVNGKLPPGSEFDGARIARHKPRRAHAALGRQRRAADRGPRERPPHGRDQARAWFPVIRTRLRCQVATVGRWRSARARTGELRRRRFGTERGVAGGGRVRRGRVALRRAVALRRGRVALRGRGPVSRRRRISRPRRSSPKC